jgi:hypothetical protein
MSDVVGTGTMAFSRGEDRSRGVEVAAGGVTAGRALEDAYAQAEAAEVVAVDVHAGRLGRAFLSRLTFGRRVLLHPPRLLVPKYRMPALWTNSYLVATVGGATLEIVNRYVENRRNA